MLTVNNLNYQQNIKFMSSKKSIGERMIDSYNKYDFPIRERLIENFNHPDLAPLRILMLIAGGMIAFVTSLFILHGHDYKEGNRKVEVKETEILHQREKELDEQYKNGTILFEEYIENLNKITSDYETLENKTKQKFENAIQSRIKHSNSKSSYKINQKTGKYDYNFSVDYKNKNVKIRAKK